MCILRVKIYGLVGTSHAKWPLASISDVSAESKTPWPRMDRPIRLPLVIHQRFILNNVEMVPSLVLDNPINYLSDPFPFRSQGNIYGPHYGYIWSSIKAGYALYFASYKFHCYYFSQLGFLSILGRISESEYKK